MHGLQLYNHVEYKQIKNGKHSRGSTSSFTRRVFAYGTYGKKSTSDTIFCRSFFAVCVSVLKLLTVQAKKMRSTQGTTNGKHQVPLKSPRQTFLTGQRGHVHILLATASCTIVLRIFALSVPRVTWRDANKLLLDNELSAVGDAAQYCLHDIASLRFEAQCCDNGKLVCGFRKRSDKCWRCWGGELKTRPVRCKEITTIFPSPSSTYS